MLTCGVELVIEGLLPSHCSLHFKGITLMSETHNTTSTGKFLRANKVGKPVTDKQRQAIVNQLEKIDMATASDILDMLSNASLAQKSDPEKEGPISDYQAGELAKLCPSRSVESIKTQITEAHGEEGYKWTYKLLGRVFVKDQSQEDREKATAEVVAEIDAVFA